MNAKPIHLLHVFPSFEIGGAQMRFVRLVELHGAQYRHTVISLDNNFEMRSRLHQDTAVQYRSVNFDKGRLWSNLSLFHKTISEVGPDVLVTYNWGAIEWALTNRLRRARRHVHIEDGFGPEEAKRQLLRRVWFRRLALSGRQTTVVLPSHKLEEIALRIWKLNPLHVLLIPNGIDCERFWVDPSSRLGPPGRPLTVGTVATLRREKNIPRLIEAFCSVAKEWERGEVTLQIVGDGPERNALQALAERTEVASQIEFTGATTHPEQRYKSMDVFALSSDTEQMPFSVLEAMAAGLPIVSPSVGDVANVVSLENKPQIVQPGNEEQYRASLQALLRNADLRLKIGLANQRQAREHFDERLMAQRYGAVFG